MISQGGKKILERFVSTAKNLLMQNITELLQQHYGIWADGHSIAVEKLANQDTDIVHTARMLRERLKHLQASFPETESDKERLAVGQLIAEQAFTQLNRFCALRMCEERDLILESIRGGYDAVGFQSYDAIAQTVGVSKYNRYKWYLHSIFDELSIELPAVFDRYSPYGLIFPDESTLLKLIELINDSQLSDWYDEQNGTTVNFWKEDETLGWMFQYYNSLEERRKMRDESNKPRNSREMAVRNQFFTPEYVVRFLTDNSLGRIWYEMTGGQSRIGEEQCRYMVRRPDEEIKERAIKEPTEILSLDPTCGSMHFGLYLYEVFEYIYTDAWDNHPELLHSFREIHTRDSFLREVPRLILTHNIYGCEIDPRALQIAALSLWLRAQRSYGEMGIDATERPLITKSNLVLAEAMPGNKRLLKGLMEELDAPMQRLITKIWDKMKFVGEAGLLFKMEKEIEEDIEYLRKNWSKVNQSRNADLFATEEERARIDAENEARRLLRQNKSAFFEEITDRLKEALEQLSAKLSEEEGYENALFSEDATRGFAFIELCQKRFDCIVMNPPFGFASENTSEYLDNNYIDWSGNLVCAFFIRMQEMLSNNGKIGCIFDKSVSIRSSYQKFRLNHFCGYISIGADTYRGVLDASVETESLVINKQLTNNNCLFIDLREIDPSNKSKVLLNSIDDFNCFKDNILNHYVPSISFSKLPNSVVGYDFDGDVLKILKYNTVEEYDFKAREGFHFSSNIHNRLFFEIVKNINFRFVYNGSFHTMFYTTYKDCEFWGKEDGIIVKSHVSYRSCDASYLGSYVIGYGKRGDIIDSHIVKKYAFYTAEGLAFPNLKSGLNAYVINSYINSILSQYLINKFAGQHKRPGYVNKLPMPNFDKHQSNIESIVNEIIEIKRHWFSLDETNLEYHGLIAQMNISESIEESINKMQSAITADYLRYQELVKDNDGLWMDLANIDRESEFRQTLNEYKNRRPYEELLSIDGASSQNIIDKKVIAQEIVQELVGMAFGRWDTAYVKREKQIPEFGDAFDALPFMPTVSLSEVPSGYGLQIPEDGILDNQADSPNSLVNRVRDVMQHIWGNQADELEYELCQLIGCKNLQSYFESPTGFFDYHFKRYTKSRRKAPIYWPLSSEDDTYTYWVYYPKLSKNTLPSLLIKLRSEDELLRSAINAAMASHDKTQESSLRAKQAQVEGMMEEINQILASGYEPNHDDGVPVTSAPMLKLVAHRGWNNECKDNLEKLTNGEYDWSHLAMSMFPARVTQKAKKDWCLALTHGLEHLCENKPKEKKTRKKKENNQTLF